jgi:dihydropteroate synthase
MDEGTDVGTDVAGRAGLPRLDRCLVMGVLNVTPDSFSDGGGWGSPQDAIAGGLAMARRGADLVDVGGESTRPGAGRVSAEEESRRVLPVIDALAEAGVVVSVDTTRAGVARAALAAGARMVNDVSGGLADPELPEVVAAAGVPYVVMHWRGPSSDMQSRATYDDVVAEVCAELADRITALQLAGVDRRQVILDPGLGFAKTAEHNWALLAELDALAVLGRPVLLGASRKSFLGSLLQTPEGLRPVADRDAASVAAATIAAYAGVWGVRVHDVAATADAVRVAAAIRQRRQAVAW